MKTRITEILGIEYPIIQGGMAWVATYELAAAVSEAGGLGIIGAGGAPASFVRDQSQKAKRIDGQAVWRECHVDESRSGRHCAGDCR